MNSFVSHPTTYSDAYPKRIRWGFLWSTVATIVFAVLLAQWIWIFIAPKDVALPTTVAWKTTSASDHLFGDVAATGASSSGSLRNVQLVGVFAHPTAGFAVLAVEGKQVGVGLGELFMSGARLVETQADHVLIEHGGIRSRIDLPADKSFSGIVDANSQPATSGSVAQTNQLTPIERTTMQQELEHFRRKP